jgi:hypothetical protein
VVIDVEGRGQQQHRTTEIARLTRYTYTQHKERDREGERGQRGVRQDAQNRGEITLPVVVRL